MNPYMGTVVHRYKKLLLPLFIMVLTPLTMSAAVPELTPLNFKTRYDVKAGPAPIGRLRITTTEDTFGYSLKIDTKTSGIARWFSGESSVAIARGRIQDGQYIPLTYTSDADKDGDKPDRHVVLRWQDGKLVERTRTPNDTPNYRPLVPIDQASAAVDPITGFFQLRHKLRDAMAQGGKTASVTTYDGARLATMSVKVVSRARIEVRGKYVDAINTIVTRTPITGYTKKELKKYAEGDPIIHAYFSADGRFMPLQLSISLSFGDIKATLTEIGKSK